MRGRPPTAEVRRPPSAARRGLPQLAARAASVQARAVFRVLAAAAVGGILLGYADVRQSAAATIVPLLAGLYIVTSTALAWPRATSPERPRGRSRSADVTRAILDVVAICAVAASVEEPRVAVLLILCAVPLGYALTLPASAVAMLTAVGLAGCLVVWGTTSPLGTEGLDEGALLLVAFALAWCGLVASLIAIERERRAVRINKLSESVRDMLRQAMSAEANERARVADLLHDDVLQLLLATRHDISDAIDGDLDLLPEARAGIEAATRRLRETIVALRDEGARDQALGDGLRGLADDPAGTRAAEVTVAVDAALEDVRHAVVVGAARDLLRDAESSSAAARVTIRATMEDDAIVLAVAHDDRRHALGLDASREGVEILTDVGARVHALDGTLDVDHVDRGERRVVIRVPVPRGQHDTSDTVPPLPAHAGSGPSPKLG